MSIIYGKEFYFWRKLEAPITQSESRRCKANGLDVAINDQPLATTQAQSPHTIERASPGQEEAYSEAKLDQKLSESNFVDESDVELT